MPLPPLWQPQVCTAWGEVKSCANVHALALYAKQAKTGQVNDRTVYTLKHMQSDTKMAYFGKVAH